MKNMFVKWYTSKTKGMLNLYKEMFNYQMVHFQIKESK